MLLLEEGGVLVEFSDLVVFEFVGGGEFAELLVEEGYVGLVLAVEGFLFAGQLGEGLLDVVYL